MLRRTPKTDTSAPERRQPRSTVTMAFVAGAAVAWALVSSFAGAVGPEGGHNTNKVDFVTMSPAKQVWNANSISAGRAESALVIGGISTVPSNATTVRLLVTVKGTQSGSLSVYPAGNPSGRRSDKVFFIAGQPTTVTVQEHVGLGDKVSVLNESGAAAAVTIQITGYSREVAAGMINSDEGEDGSVLTTNGNGLTTWKPPVAMYSVEAGPNLGVNLGTEIIATLEVPAGEYFVIGTVMVAGTDKPSGQLVRCWARTASGGESTPETSVHIAAGGGRAVITTQGAISTQGEDVAFACAAYVSGDPDTSYNNPTLTAIRIGPAT